MDLCNVSRRKKEIAYEDDDVSVNSSDSSNFDQSYEDDDVSVKSSDFDQSSNDCSSSESDTRMSKKSRLQIKNDEKVSDDTSDNPYFLMIKKNIEVKNEMLKTLGFFDTKKTAAVKKTAAKKTAAVKKTAPVRELLPLPVREKSLRIQGKNPPNEIDVEALGLSSTFNYKRKLGPIPMESIEDDDGACNQFLVDIVPYLSTVTSARHKLTGSLDSFKKSVKELALYYQNKAKVTSSRITSIAVHPSETKLLVVAGDIRGHIGFWDVLDRSKSCVQVFRPHSVSVRCMSFCRYNSTVLYTTGVEGCVRRCDLKKLVLDEFYSSDMNTKYNSTTWHSQMNAHTLMVAHKTGKVAFVDSRETQNSVKLYDCHDFWVKTVHCHPLEEHTFVTSSTLGEVKIWDARHINKRIPKPVLDLMHPNSLQSAFFSSSGNFLLTTCNDDRLRIYQLSTLPRVVTNVKHNNQPTHIETPFQAIWHPQREDVFIVGSMEHPRRVEVFAIHGKILHNLQDDHELRTIQTCVQFHPTQLVVVGANSSGMVHVFRSRELDV